MGISSTLELTQNITMKTFVALLALSAMALADQPPAYNVDYPDTDPIYKFGYNVYNDGQGYEHQNFKQEEERSGYQTHGEYSVQLPDGRIQRVVYRVDGDSGFIADVTYEGEAKPYDYHAAPAYKPAPAPAYVPAPAPVVYKPAPVVYKPAPVPAAPVYKPAPVPHPAPAKKDFGPVRFNPFGR